LVKHTLVVLMSKVDFSHGGLGEGLAMGWKSLSAFTLRKFEMYSSSDWQMLLRRNTQLCFWVKLIWCLGSFMRIIR